MMQAIEKACGLTVPSQHRETTRNRRAADRRCCLDETSETGKQRSIMHLAVHTAVCHDAKFVHNLFKQNDPVEALTGGATSLRCTCGY